MDNYLNQVLGERYEIKEIIGVGGMSVVYKAYDRVDDRIVAVKILKDEFLANEEFRLRFKNESKVISVLSHPNIVKVYDVSFGETLQYIVMEHVEGITLKEYIERQNVLDWKEALHFVVQILRALQHAHDKGIIHRDIKPQNILLLPNANIKVTDFGIARFNRSEKNINESGAIGSVHYMCPEQARGDYTDARSDIYSVGVVLYEMLTGKLPFESENDISVALMQMREDAKKPSSINSSIPIGLEQITLRAMQKDPADRYQSAAEFLLDLDEFKRNPLIKFDYSYFIDKNPTKFVNPAVASAVSSAAAAPVRKDAAPVRIDASAEEEEPEQEDEEEEEPAPRNMTIPILAGIAVSLVVVVGLIFVLAFADPIKSLITGGDESSSSSSFWSKLDIFGWFSKDKIEVPNFINMEYEKVLEKYPDLVITPEYVNNSKYEDGHVCKQSPNAGEKVSKDTVITLTVVTSSEMVLIRDVTGLDYIEAETVLRSLGFTVEGVPTADEAKNRNEVIYTLPSVNTYAPYNSTIRVYYASDAADNEMANVPNVVGDEESIARAKITAAGLKVGSVIYAASSERLNGFVIGQTPSEGSTVKSRTYVNLTVGNGVPDAATATFSIYLPVSEKNSGKGTMKTYLNNKQYDVIQGVKLDGSTYQLSFTGSGEDNTFKIYIDNSLIYTGKIDFSTSPASISGVSAYSYATAENIPNVVGLSKASATAKLEKEGFKNIKYVEEYSADTAAGIVCGQSPVASNLTKYSTGIAITLTISKGPDPNAVTEPPETTTEPPVTDPGIEPTTEPPKEPTTEALEEPTSSIEEPEEVTEQATEA